MQAAEFVSKCCDAPIKFVTFYAGSIPKCKKCGKTCNALPAASSPDPHQDDIPTEDDQ